MLDQKDKQLLNLLQTEFPLDVRPFAVIAERLDMSEDEIISRIRRLREEKIIRQISAIFDSRSLGYQSSLVAFKADPVLVQQIAGKVSEHKGVSHNYRRNHEYNLWFTITVPTGTDLQAEVESLAAQEGVFSARLFPTIRLFKIGVAFNMLSEDSPGASVSTAEIDVETEVCEDDIPVIRELQRDLPLEPRPFEPLARRIGLTDEALVEKARELLQRKLMRRYAAVLRHREAGFSANAMAAWNVPEAEIDSFGAKAASFSAVSHCYQRPTYPDWPYSIFTMIHGRSREECEGVARQISKATMVSDYILLYSTEEYKKARVRYFEE